MPIEENISEKIDQRIKKIEKDVFSGKINLLNLELVPIFSELKDTLAMYNLSSHSKVYINACALLNRKFEELKNLLSSLDNEEKFNVYLKSNPKDIEIYSLFEKCWRKSFEIEALSYKFLKDSKDQLEGRSSEPITITHLETQKKKGKFLLETPTRRFTELMNDFYEKIIKHLPCSFDEIFDDLNNQIEIYEKFVFILHLLQLGKLKYQKETNTLYI
ncbi:MAG: hypothetical protein P8Y70_05110 [Candidatus Lokiarchaeota archaeon]